jgi:Zn-dependent M28 family amino/carboxypeptidase
MLSEMLQPRDAGQPEKLDEVAAYIRTEFARYSTRVIDQPYTVHRASYRNVIASFGPESGERIVVGAHYDTDDAFPGADDNASGVAGLLELGRLLARADLPLRVDLVAYTLEEPPYFASPYMGSAVHAAGLKQAGVPLRLMISLEMIGYFSDVEGSQEFPVSAMGWLYPRTGNFITVAGAVGEGLLVRRIKSAMRAASDLPVYSLNVPSTTLGVDLSDQRNYWALGYDAVMISDTAFFRNKNYHTADDTAEKLDYARMAKVVDGVDAVIVQEANAAR